MTVAISFNAAGSYVPPLLNFPRVRMKYEFMNGIPPRSVYTCHRSGWIQNGIFIKWFEHFLKQTKPTAEAPVLFILDGHSTHIKNLELLNTAREDHVVILCLPPHCTHRMQPADVTFMNPLSSYFDAEVTTWLRNHPGRVVAQFQFGEILGKAYIRAAQVTTAINGFHCTGICPVDNNIFPDNMFAAADVTNDNNQDGSDQRTTHGPSICQRGATLLIFKSAATTSEYSPSCNY